MNTRYFLAEYLQVNRTKNYILSAKGKRMSPHKNTIVNKTLLHEQTKVEEVYHQTYIKNITEFFNLKKQCY